jgi:hypothetical protein
MPRGLHWGALLLAIGTPATAARAGMPSALPQDFATVLRLSGSAEARLQAISFFLLGIGLSALAVMLLWNYLRRDFSRLPRLTYFKALAIVVAWGLVFVIVLTMISGARELMTPGAWRKQGLTYTIDDAQPSSTAASPKVDGAAPLGEPEASY